MLRTARLVAGKDLRVELRGRVVTNQVLPFALLVLVLFAFALDPDRGVLRTATPGLYWVAVLFTLVVAVQRSSGLEQSDGTRDALRLSGLDPAGVFLGKAASLALMLVVVELVLGLGIVVLYDAELLGAGALLLGVTVVVTSAALAATGTLYGALTGSIRGRETLLPLLLLPVVAPVLIGATRASEAALGTGGAGTSEGWPWVGLLAVFALIYIASGLLAYGALLEEA
ncbi:MAG TPA: heme exporter protein CcmB [Acidimicrobiales bacterium]